MRPKVAKTFLLLLTFEDDKDDIFIIMILDTDTYITDTKNYEKQLTGSVA